MNNFIRTLIAGYGAKKLGGGCLSTILVFIVIYWALGQCNNNSNNNVQRRTGQEMKTTAPVQSGSPESTVGM